MNGRRVRCWSFADCLFDEANWLLTVGGRRVAIESKPLELLRELLLNAGNLVSKGDLLDAIWPDTAVVEASLPTAIRKLRLALGDDDRAEPIIETIPRIGYRLAVPVSVEEVTAPPALRVVTAQADRPGATPPAPWFSLRKAAGGLAAATALLAVLLWPSQKMAAEIPARPAPRVDTNYLRQWDSATALRKMDLPAIERMLAEGWDPTTPFDEQGNGALNILLNNCEWDKDHDRRRMLVIARTLIDGGEKLDRRNVWGDTAYSIAAADRYCGPDHPVTRMMHAMCYASPHAPRDRCLADYKNSEWPQLKTAAR